MTCFICDSLKFKHLYELPNGKIIQCLGCETVCRENLVSGDVAHDLYQDENYLNSSFFDALKVGADTTVEPYIIYNKVLKRLDEKVGENKRLLDIGCSYGAFLDTARQYGWEVSGVDLSQQASSYASSERNLSVHCGTLEEAKYPDHYFSVVALWDVIEHLDRPLDTLKEVNRILAPGGTVIIFTINQKSLINYVGHTLYKLSFNTFIRPLSLLYDIHHNVFFCRETLNTLLRRAGISEKVDVDWMDANIERWQTIPIPWLLAFGSKCLDLAARIIGQPYRMIFYATKSQ